MSKAKNSLIIGAALAGLLAGSSAVQASTLLSGVKTGFNAATQDKDAASDKKEAKDKHACKGQNSCKGKGGCKGSDNGCKGKNSCKGKGGCRTDGKKMEAPKPS
ncbi:MAG TPA: hypothetical protein VNY24_21265 [Candidatus Acidoferrales bacterium]|jgi:hypothetical protein|nr:hypothetical protein [Candidatus Acidoferrales bacterium]